MVDVRFSQIARLPSRGSATNVAGGLVPEKGWLRPITQHTLMDRSSLTDARIVETLKSSVMSVWADYKGQPQNALQGGVI